MLALLKRPSAFLPLTMSSVVLALIFVHIARFGIAPERDEGTEAHVFQILMPAQIPIVAFFVLKWLPRHRRETLEVLTIQGGAIIAVFSLVFFLRW
jgi:hypothetical protein